MTQKLGQISRLWLRLGPRFLPFADAATPELPLGRLLRLSLFQVSAGMTIVLLNGTLNRVMILELHLSAMLVAGMVALPLLIAPSRAILGFKSDTHRSVLGWKRVPYIWMGALFQFGGLAILPFALLLLSGDTTGPMWIGQIAAAVAFLLVGLGLHTAQTAGLALASDLAPPASRPRVVAFLYVMMLAGMIVSAIVFGFLLTDFSKVKLIQVVQATALFTILLNGLAMWKQEPRLPMMTQAPDVPSFKEAWRTFLAGGRWTRILIGLALGTAAFSMQDILLEPYGGEVLKMTVAQTTTLTAIFAVGALAGLALAARVLSKGLDAYRLASGGVLIGLLAFAAVIFSAPLGSTELFQFGAFLIGLGGGLFAVGTLTAAMELADGKQAGLALGAWGAVQACAMGGSIALGGAIRDAVAALAAKGSLGPALMGPEAGYLFVYHIEIGLLFATLAAIGPLVQSVRQETRRSPRFGLAEFPG